MLFALFVLKSAVGERELIFEVAAFVILASIIAHGLTDTVGSQVDPAPDPPTPEGGAAPRRNRPRPPEPLLASPHPAPPVPYCPSYSPSPFLVDSPHHGRRKALLRP